MSDENQQDTAQTAPIRKWKLRLNYGATWANETDNGIDYSTEFYRRYRDAEGKWHRSERFRFDDLLEVAKLAQLAHTEIMYRLEAKT